MCITSNYNSYKLSRILSNNPYSSRTSCIACKLIHPVFNQYLATAMETLEIGSITSFSTSMRTENYVWTILIDPGLYTKGSAYMRVQIPEQRFLYGTLRTVNHTCFAESIRPNAKFYIYLDMPPSTSGKYIQLAKVTMGLLVGARETFSQEIPQITTGLACNKPLAQGMSRSGFYVNLNGKLTDEIDSLKITLQFKIEDAPIGKNLAPIELPNKTNSRPTENFEKFYNNKFLSDVTIKCGSEEIPAHKFILAHRSPVFFKMFEGDNLETLQNQVTLSSDRSETVVKMLEWIYNPGRINNLDLETAIELYKLAHRYELVELRRICSTEIYSSVGVETALEVYIFAMVYEDKPIVDKAVSIVLRNKATVFADKAICAEYFEKYPTSMQPFLTEKFDL